MPVRQFVAPQARVAALGALLAMLMPRVATAQDVWESVGSRALGMAGAFVAVADDPSAVYWNPAGLVSGAPAGATIEWSRLRTGNQSGSPVPGPTSRSATLGGLGTWPLGLSYLRQQSTVLAQGSGGSTVTESLATSQLGATVLQTVVQGIVVGSTLKYLRGTVGTGLAQSSTVHDALDLGSALQGAKTQGTFDLDVGVMVDMTKVRLGYTMRNVRSPTFHDAAGFAISLKRVSRVGVAVLPANGLILAADLDLDTVDPWDGPRRMIAFGGEDRLGPRLAVRGGIRWSVEGLRRRVVAVGVSIAIQRSLWLDSHFTRGDIDGDRGFGVALRAGS